MIRARVHLPYLYIRISKEAEGGGEVREIEEERRGAQFIERNYPIEAIYPTTSFAGPGGAVGADRADGFEGVKKAERERRSSRDRGEGPQG